MQIIDDNCCKDERCRMTLLPSSSLSTSTNFYVPVTTVNMQPNHIIHNSYVQYYDEKDNGNDDDNGDYDDGDNDDDDDDDGDGDGDGDDGNDSNDNIGDNIRNKKMKHNANGVFFGSTYHYLQIDRNSINILLKVAAAFVLLCIAGCLVLQHLRINRLDYRIRRIEINSAYSIQV
ncbi:hypothetical protein LOAG_14449 [Loa loa]|uniref:Uncharacterized protein n=1 Tax=Loa loa TaxID=7209 RepID=A0A1S0TI88_LOALO|nr:hypothetical protein LOAG_14449 [Loa loa]EFO14075.2 hypothetical protein LOAG_14449 [Loa loa]